MKKSPILIAFVVLCTGCGSENPVRQYREIVIEAPSPDPHAGLDLSSMRLPTQQQTDDPQMQQMLQDSVMKLPIAWDVPPAWQAMPGEGMRLASFKTSDADPIACTIVSLGGAAGGVEENIRRWMKQISLETPDDIFTEYLNQIPIEKSDAGVQFRLIDLSMLQENDAPNADSMIAAMMELPEGTIFIKMTGSRKAVGLHKENFLHLCRSIRLTHE